MLPKFCRKVKNVISSAEIIGFSPQNGLKIIVSNACYYYGFKKFGSLFLALSKNRFQLRHSTMYIKVRKSIFKRLHHLFLTSRKLQNHIPKCFLWRDLDLNNFECFASVCKKIISASSIINLQKMLKTPFSNVQNICFLPKGSLKTFS